MMKLYPDHLHDSVQDASARFADELSEHHKFYKLVCRCGRQAFDLWISNKASVIAMCNACSKEIIVYDRAHYPAAVKSAGQETFSPLRPEIKSPYTVFVMYEYGPLDPDQDFDRNDITWCQVFIETSSTGLIKVFDEEAA